MKLIMKSIVLSVSALVCIQPASAITVPSWMTNKGSLAVASIIGGYTVCKGADTFLPWLFPNKTIDENKDSAETVEKTTKYNEHMKSLRETIQISLPEFIEAYLNHKKCGNKLNTFLLVNSFNIWNSIKTVANNITIPKLEMKTLTNGLKTSVYIAAGISQSYVPNLIQNQRYKPVAKFFTRSFTNKLLEWVYGKEDKYNESVKDLFDFGMRTEGILSDWK